MYEVSFILFLTILLEYFIYSYNTVTHFIQFEPHPKNDRLTPDKV